MEIEKITVINGVYQHISMDQIADILGKSKSYVAILCADLERDGYIDNPYVKGGPRRAVARKLTEKGMQVLRDEHLVR
jgi:transposase